MNAERLHELVSRFPQRRIAVLGDFFLDKYMEVDPSLAEISLETEKTAYQVVQVRHSPGAAGTVTGNLAALGAGELIPIGFCGDDGEGYDLRKDLQMLGCRMDYFQVVPERMTPTYLKPRDTTVGGLEAEHERYDIKNRDPLPPRVEQKVIDALLEVAPRVDAVITMDQVEEEGCGVVTSRAREVLAEVASRTPDKVLWADSRRLIHTFRNVIIKPNQFEAVKAAFPSREGEIDDDLVLKAGRALAERSGKPVFVTRSERGMLVFDGEEVKAVRGVRIEGPIDPTGAGDSVTASSVLTLASGGAPEEAALIANLVGSITVQQIGVTGTASPEQLPDRLALWHRQG